MFRFLKYFFGTDQVKCDMTKYELSLIYAIMREWNIPRIEAGGHLLTWSEEPEDDKADLRVDERSWFYLKNINIKALWKELIRAVDEERQRRIK